MSWIAWVGVIVVVPVLLLAAALSWPLRLTGWSTTTIRRGASAGSGST